PWFVTSARLNGDAFADLVVANRASNVIAVFLNSGTGTFGAPTTYAVQTSPEAVLAVELGGGGCGGVVGGESGGGTLTFYSGDGTGALGSARSVAVGSYPFGAQPHSVVAGDINHDGHPDLVVANKVSKNVSVLLNDGHGGFSSLINVGVTPGPDYAVLT